MGVTCGVSLGVLTTPADAVAQKIVLTPYQWRNVAIEGGGFVPGIVPHPTAPDLLYVRTDVGGAFRFDPAADRWIALNDDIDRAHAEWTGITSLAVDPHHPDRLYLAAGAYPQVWGDPGALLRSDDRGASWASFPLPFKLLGNADGRNTGERLLVDPTDSAVLWLGSAHDGLWRSADRGATWHRVPDLPEAGVTTVFTRPGHPRELFAAFVIEDAAAAPLWHSADGGATWAPLPGQPTGLLVHQAAWDAGDRLYLTTGNGFGPNGVTAGECWRYDPADASWHNLTPTLAAGAERADHGFAGLATDPHTPGSVLVASLNRWHDGNQLWRSTDGGRSWTSCFDHATWDHRGVAYTEPLSPHWIADVAIDPQDPRRVWFVTGYGLWTTADIAPADGAAVHWEFSNHGLEETVAEDLLSPAVGAPLLSAMGDIGGFRHDDLDTPSPVGAFAPGHGSSSSIANAGLAPREIVRTHSAPARGARSSDGGRTWRLLPAAPDAARQHSAGSLVLNADASRLLWLPKGGRVHVSSDDGETWTASSLDYTAPNNHLTARLAADRVDPDLAYLYAPESGAYFVSTDGGDHWNLVQAFAANGGILRAEPDRAGVVWIPTDKGLYVSTAAGRHFRKLVRVDAAYQLGFGAPAPGHDRAAVFMQGRIDGQEGLYRSDDGGAAWTRIDDPAHRYGWLRAISGDGQVPGRVYLGTSGRGIIVGEPTAR